MDQQAMTQFWDELWSKNMWSCRHLTRHFAT